MEKEFLEGLGIGEEAVAAILEAAQERENAHQQEIRKVRFDSALEQAVMKAGGRNLTAIRALLDMDSLANGEEGAIEKALKELKKTCGYLFESQMPPAYAPGTGARQVFQPDEPKTLADALREKFKKKS